MPALDSTLIFLPRFTTLVGETTFTTAPLDVSGQAGTQFQVWRGPMRVTAGTPSFTLYLEESLDAASWALGPSTPQGFAIAENATVFFAYSFRLRWFRIRVVLGGTNAVATCWAEGILRAGDGGMWGLPLANPESPHGSFAGLPPTAQVRSAAGSWGGAGSPPSDPWAAYRQFASMGVLPGQDPSAYFNQMVDLWRDGVAKGGIAGAPPAPTFPGIWMPNAGIPVTPPQLGVQGGP